MLKIWQIHSVILCRYVHTLRKIVPVFVVSVYG